MNHGTYIGRVGADAELRTTQSGSKVLNWRMAVDTGFGDRKRTDWYDCQYWGKAGEAVSNFITKGMKLTVFGEVWPEEFQRRDNTPGFKMVLNVSNVGLPDRKDGGGQRENQGEERYGSGTPGGGYGGTSYRDSQGGNLGGYGGGSGGSNRGGSKPAYDQDLDDDIPF